VSNVIINEKVFYSRIWTTLIEDLDSVLP